MGDRHHMSRRGPNTSLYVRPIDGSTRPDEIKLLFQEYGTVRDVHIPIDFNTRQPRGFAYIEFESIEDAEYAQKKLNRTRLGDKMLHVDFAQGDRKTPGQMKSQKEATALRLQIEEVKQMQAEALKKAREDEMRREGIPISKSDRDAYSDRRYTKRDDRDDRRRDRRDRSRDRESSRSSRKDRDDRGHRDRDRGERRGGDDRDRRRDRSRSGDRGYRKERDYRRERDDRSQGRDRRDGGDFKMERSRSPRRDDRRGDRGGDVYSGHDDRAYDDRGFGNYGASSHYGHDDRGGYRPNYDP